MMLEITHTLENTQHAHQIDVCHKNVLEVCVTNSHFSKRCRKTREALKTRNTHRTTPLYFIFSKTRMKYFGGARSALISLPIASKSECISYKMP
jgi:hypothetical protein